MERMPHLPITMVTTHYGYFRQSWSGLGKSSAVYAICKGSLYSPMRPVTVALNEREAVEACHRLENEHHTQDTCCNPGRKLSDDQVAYIREHYTPHDKRYGGAALANRFGVSRTSINKIVHGKTYMAV